MLTEWKVSTRPTGYAVLNAQQAHYIMGEEGKQTEPKPGLFLEQDIFWGRISRYAFNTVRKMNAL